MTRFQNVKTVFGDFRIGRIIMLTLVPASVSFGLGGSWVLVLLSGLIGATLSTSGFYLDSLLDYEEDRKSGKIHNPLARGALSPRTGIIIVLICLSICIIVGILVNYWILLPILCVIFIIGGLSTRAIGTPLLRAIGLGAIQAFYVLVGALVVYRFELGVILISLFLFFAMTGARVLGDTRDLPYDQKIETNTIPKKYGVRWASLFLLVNEIMAYVVGIAVYWTGILNIVYLFCMIGIIIVGLPLTLFFIFWPTPRNANIANMLSLGILGILFILGMILGRL
ncbi:MAG: UbiA prenyltransferase family protein [Candidatus Hodarchaeota archaeon]